MTFICSVLTARAGRREWRVAGFEGLMCYQCVAACVRIFLLTFLVNCIGMVQTEELGHDE
jgi:hypothetical protein